jgi:hypothetical protein
MKHEMHVLGIDIAKCVFHAVGMDNTGNIVSFGQKCLEVSTSRGRRFVEGMGAGRTGGGAWGDAVSRSHRAQWGLWVRPSKGLGPLERWRLGVRGSGSAGASGAVTGRVARVRGTRTKSQRSASRMS